MHNLQQHMNILGNNIFMWHLRNWKEEPDYTAAVHHYYAWTAQEGIVAA